MTGNICAREIKLPYQANVSKCPISCDKNKIEFPALPENESQEEVFEVSNHSQKNFLIEIVPPNPKLSGLYINPLVKQLSSGSSMLISMKYTSLFREFNAQALEKLNKPIEKQGEDGEEVPKGMVRNKKLLAKIEEKKQAQAADAKADPKAKGGKAPPPKEEKKAPPAKGKKGEPVVDPAEEEERLRKEAEAAEAARIAEMEANFDQAAELRKKGGKLLSF